MKEVYLSQHNIAWRECRNSVTPHANKGFFFFHCSYSEGPPAHAKHRADHVQWVSECILLSLITLSVSDSLPSMPVWEAYEVPLHLG